MWLLRQILAPLRYLRIRQGDGLLASKLTYDLTAPLISSGAVTVIIILFNLPFRFFGDEGLANQITPMLNILIPFFIGALAAVSSFDRAGLDEKLKGDPAILKLRHKDGIKKDVILTNRQFLSYMFGFLTFSSFLGFISILLVDFTGVLSVFSETASSGINFYARAVPIFIFLYWLFHLVFTMFLGLYFLTDRLQFLDRSDI